MIAKELNQAFGDRQVYPILDSMLTISDRARYYSLSDTKVMLYLITDHELRNLPDNLDWLYQIGNKIYETLGTNDISYFENNEISKQEIQLSLF